MRPLNILLNANILYRLTFTYSLLLFLLLFFLLKIVKRFIKLSLLYMPAYALTFIFCIFKRLFMQYMRKSKKLPFSSAHLAPSFGRKVSSGYIYYKT